MMSVHRVYYKEKWIELTDNQNGKVSEGVQIEFENGKTFDYAVKLLDSRSDLGCVSIVYSNSEALFIKLLKHFKSIKAAGGIVENEKGQVLVIFRHGRWDLPKGKLKMFENEKKGAIREVEEECGVTGLSVTGEFAPTYHMYEMKGKMVVKKTWWFLMHASGEQKLTPQTEEGITKVEWFDKKDLNKVLNNTFSSIKQVIREYQERFTQ
jgi:8-oxo-dGTP pyrophosphatase MutT (NUDIX family)